MFDIRKIHFKIMHGELISFFLLFFFGNEIKYLRARNNLTTKYWNNTIHHSTKYETHSIRPKNKKKINNKQQHQNEIIFFFT